jgi:chemotaxis signal transduction protein
MRPSDAFKMQGDLNEVSSLEQDNEFLLSFNVGTDRYAVMFDDVNEVVNFTPVVEYPVKIENHIGVINLRGTIVPIINPFSHSIIGDLEKAKYVIFKTKFDNYVGIIVNGTKKIEVEKNILENIEKNQIVSFESKPLRIVKMNDLLVDFNEKAQEYE